MRLTNDNYENDALSLKNKTQGEYNKELWEYAKSREDIEEELGIDLITYVKIHQTNKFYIEGKDCYWKIHHYCHKGIVVGTNKLIYLPYKQYGKTWRVFK